MEKTNLPAVTQSPVRLTVALINQQANTKDMLELEPVQNQWVQTYKKITGREDGNLKFEAEKMLFLQAINNNAALEKCENFSKYAAFVELAASGLSLRDGLTYIIPYSKKAQFQVGWKGRLEQINQMDNVIYCPEPQLIRQGDVYAIEAGERLRITHTPVLGSKGEILCVYIALKMQHGIEFYKMDREEVLAIRDQYSQSYKSYIAALALPANKGKKAGDKLTIEYYDKNTQSKKTFESDECPMWISSEGQAFKKTLVKRIYNNLPKLPHQKYLDERIAERIRETHVDVDEIEDDKMAALQNAMNIEGATEVEVMDSTTSAHTDEAIIENVLAPVVVESVVETVVVVETEQPKAGSGAAPAAQATDLFAGLGTGL